MLSFWSEDGELDHEPISDSAVRRTELLSAAFCPSCAYKAEADSECPPTFLVRPPSAPTLFIGAPTVPSPRPFALSHVNHSMPYPCGQIFG